MIIKNNRVFKQFEELPVFQEAHKLTLSIYKKSIFFPQLELYGLTSQIRRSSSSIAANIVEVLFKNTKKELIQFLYNARASAAETSYHLLLAKDLGYLDILNYEKLRDSSDEIIRQLIVG